MVKVWFIREGDEICGFSIKGHAGFREHGRDIICAAISAISQQVVIGIVNYLKIDAKPEIKDGFLQIDLREIDRSEWKRELDTLFQSMYMMLLQIEEQYPKQLRLYEKKEENNV